MAISTHSILPNLDQDLLKFFIGFGAENESIRKSKEANLRNQSNYPPYNIKSIGDTNYVIEIAVAGFKQEDLEVELLNRTLTVVGKATEEDANVVYLHRGLASRAFTRTFTLAERVEISDVILQDGLLKIYLAHIIPESQKSRKLEINSPHYKMLLG
jgi:molecular chaperone IbpA